MPRQATRRGHLYKPQPAFSLLARAIALVTAARKVKFVDGILRLKLASLTVRNSPQVDQIAQSWQVKMMNFDTNHEELKEDWISDPYRVLGFNVQN